MGRGRGKGYYSLQWTTQRGFPLKGSLFRLEGYKGCLLEGGWENCHFGILKGNLQFIIQKRFYLR